MSGISRIQKGREDSRRPVEQDRGKEIFLKDGSQIFATSVATGADDDKLLDELYLYTFRVGNRWTNLIKDPKIDASAVPEDTRASHKFAFWAYVHHIFHAEKRNDDWEQVEGPAGQKVFKETVDDFRIIILGFGRSDYVWNQLVEVYSDWGGLDKGVVRVKRTGSGMYDTSYSVTATAQPLEVPAKKLKEVKDLATIKDYFFERYSTPPTQDDINLMNSSKEEEKDLNLF